MSERSLRFVLLGHPVSHSMSPAMHREAYSAMGLDYRYDAVDAPDESAVRAAVARIRSGELSGANVTVPWKRLALAEADRLDPLAEDTGAANVLVHDQGAVVAHNTDVLALADELRGGATSSGVAAVIGSGGAALAAVVACRSLGIRRIVVTARRWQGEGAWPRAQGFRRLGAHPMAWPSGTGGDWLDAVRGATLVVQATSAGMLGADDGAAVRDIVPWPEIRPDAVAYDVVYNPPVTPFLRAAQDAGVESRGGLGMLVGQAARSIEIWLGRSPPLDVMRRVAEARLAD